MMEQVIGTNFLFYQSLAGGEGRYNGSYDPQTSTIVLDLNAGRNGATDKAQFAILRTEAHELTHYIAERNRADYQRFVVDNLMDKGLEQLIGEKQAQYAAQGVELTREQAIEEVVVDGCEMMLKDSQAIQKLVEQDRNLAQKVLDWLRNFIDKLRKAFDGVSYEHREAALLMQTGTLKYLEGLQEMWDQALMGTVEGKTTGMDGAKFQARALNDPQLYKDAEMVTDADARAMFKMCRSLTARKDTSKDRSYFPVRNTTPSWILEKTNVNSAAMIMQVFKARQAQAPENIPFGNSHGHNIPADSLIKIIHSLDDPIFRGERQDGRFVAVVESPDLSGIYVLIEPTQNKNKAYMNGYSGGRHTLILTLYKRKSVDDAIEYAERDAYKTKTLREEVPAAVVPSHSNETFDIIIPSGAENINRKFSLRNGNDAIAQKENEFSSIWEAYRAKQADLRTVEEEYRKAGEAPEYLDAVMALINYSGSKFTEEGRAERRRLKKNYQEVVEKLGINRLSDQKDALAEEVKKLSGDMQRVEAELAAMRESAAIAKSGLSEAEYFRKQAVKEFGYTPHFLDAGYLLPNGKMLNFSGEKGKHFGVRGQDHRAIGVVYEGTTGTQAMTRFMRDGNIRIMAESPGIDLVNMVEPTAEQYAAIRKMVREYAGKRYFNVDISDENGRSVGNLSYTGSINADRVANDIKHYFATGEVREQSSLESFRYQLRDYSTLSEREILAGADPASFKMEGVRGFLEEYQGALGKLDELNAKLARYQDEERNAQNRDEQVTARNRVQIAQKQVNDQENRVSRLEAREQFHKALEAERQSLENTLAFLDPVTIAGNIRKYEGRMKELEELRKTANEARKLARALYKERNRWLKTADETCLQSVHANWKKRRLIFFVKDLILFLRMINAAKCIRICSVMYIGVWAFK